MILRHKTPCAECPWRKVAPAGWLGGHPAEYYADAVANNEVPACHQRDHGPDSDNTSMCAGALSVMSNACILPHKTEGGPEARTEVGKNPDTFGHPAQFFKHHTGNDYVPWFMRMR